VKRENSEIGDTQSWARERERKLLDRRFADTVESD
jgi:hypothetical protein